MATETKKPQGFRSQVLPGLEFGPPRNGLRGKQKHVSSGSSAMYVYIYRSFMYTLYSTTTLPIIYTISYIQSHIYIEFYGIFINLHMSLRRHHHQPWAVRSSFKGFEVSYFQGVWKWLDWIDLDTIFTYSPTTWGALWIIWGAWEEYLREINL